MNTKPYMVSWSEQAEAQGLDLQKAQGATFILKNGSRVFDALSTSFQASFGHAYEPILEAIRDQMQKDAIAFPKAFTTLKTQVSQRLIDALDCGAGRMFYTVSGAESVENALKMSRQIRSAQVVVARHKSYHGASLGALSVTGDWRNTCHKTIDEWTLRIPEPKDDPNASEARQRIEDYGPNKIAAFCLETITGANGVYLADQTWWKGIESICQDYQIHLILDEVLCGFARTGSLFAFQQYQLKPDFVVMSKAMSGGYIPIGGVWLKEEHASYYDQQVLSCGLTNYAHPLALAALNAVLDTLAHPAFLSELRQFEEQFAEDVNAFKEQSNVCEVRCRGLLAAIDFKQGHGLTWRDFADAGVHLLCKEDQLILAPPFVMGIELWKKCLALIHQCLKSGAA